MKVGCETLLYWEWSRGVPFMSHQYPFKWRHFQPDIILLCVRWYVRDTLSYRDLEEMMLERGLSIDHTMSFRWVQRDAPEMEKRGRPHLKACNASWKVDATAIKCGEITMAHLCGGSRLERESSIKESKCHAKRAKNGHQGVQN